MNKYDLIGVIRDYCQANNIHYIPSISEYDAYVNAVADGELYEEYDLIFCTFFTLRPSFGGSVVQSVTYNGTCALGRKREENTVSNLDETFIQKYDARLKNLTELLVSMLAEIACNVDGEITNCNLSYDINKLDLNADFIGCELSIKCNGKRTEYS
ncbi:MAG: hypothetical protein MJ197_08640 [Bacteroidales bacterium]|nr:hypothetical protein [Bacteroidales bacterium]